MSSAVDICNLALSHLGESATVSSIDPPEGSAQAELCATFYPIARNNILELHEWGFSIRRAALALMTSTITQWAYAYAVPANMVRILSIQPTDSADDNSVSGIASPVPYSVEINENGVQVIYSDTENAYIRYTSKVEDTTLFSPLFITTLSWQLAAMLAGPVIKGDPGKAAAIECEKMTQFWIGRASESNAQQKKSGMQHSVTWMAGR